MTLKTRDRIFFSFFILSIIAIIFYVAFLIYSIVTKNLVAPVNEVRPLNFSVGKRLYTYNFTASLISILTFLVYVSVVTFVLFSGFETTQSTEIVYFLGFVLSCFIEGTRLFLPIFGLWKTNSILVYFIGRCVFAARIMAPLSLLFSAIFSDADLRQDVDKNIIILLVISILFAVLVPINTTYFFTTCTVPWSYRELFNAMRIVFFCLTLITIIVNAIKSSSVELREYCYGFVILMIGYSLLQVADNYFTLISAAVLFGVGTTVYLKSIHTIYMWK
ncbi:MAG: hypothetical protein WCQ67_08395 [Treponema sp.]